MNGSSDREGRVEVCIGNTWTAVSENGWDYREAQVVCRQLNLPYQCMLYSLTSRHLSLTDLYLNDRGCPINWFILWKRRSTG